MKDRAQREKELMHAKCLSVVCGMHGMTNLFIGSIHYKGQHNLDGCHYCEVVTTERFKPLQELERLILDRRFGIPLDEVSY